MKYAKIGGQAVMEGIMMRNGDDYAVAVRKADGTIEIKEDKYIGLAKKLHLKKVPIIRGMFAFVDSLVLGMQCLTYSATFFEEEDEGEKARSEKPPKKEKDTEKSDKVIMGFTVLFSIVIAIALFMVLPFFISSIFKKHVESSFLLALVEGIIRIAIFLAYIFAISRMKDIQRVFMYHGAEHKTINCIEHGVELTPENALAYSRLHKRCGTSFLLIVMVISIIFFMFLRFDNMIMKVVFRILLVPVIAGVSFEIIQWAGRSESKLVGIISKPGMWLQGLTTREPDASMIEVAIAAVEKIYDWRAFQEEVKNGKTEY